MPLYILLYQKLIWALIIIMIELLLFINLYFCIIDFFLNQEQVKIIAITYIVVIYHHVSNNPVFRFHPFMPVLSCSLRNFVSFYH